LTSLNANNLTIGTVPLARLSGITSNQLDATTWQLATNLNGGNAALATNVVSGISITNAFVTNSVFAGDGTGLTNVNATTLGGSITSNSFAALSNALNVETNRATTAEFALSTNMAHLNGTNSFTGTNNFSGVTIATNLNNIFNGTFTGSGAGLTNAITAGNYVFAYDTTLQSIISAGVFQDIKFNSIGQLNGWVHTSGSGSFTNTQTGLYLIQYSAELNASTAGEATVSVRGTLNGTEIPGSQSVVSVMADRITTIAKTFLVSAASGNTLKLQFTCKVGGAIANIGSGATTPSVSCTVIRIQ
jgi:hypothetical protein